MSDRIPGRFEDRIGAADGPRFKTILDIAMLFASKTGAVVVGVLFLPIYHQQLGNETFGVVAIILSIQAFALMIDFGMSALVGRDVAHGEPGSSKGLTVWRQAEVAVISVYSVILLTALVTCGATGVSGPQFALVIGGVVLCLLTVLQNIGQTVLIAGRQFVTASTIQIVGVLVRAIATAIALTHREYGLLTFVAVQAATTALHLLVTRRFCRKFFAVSRTVSALTWSEVANLLSRGRPLVLSGLAGAAVLQLDKPLVSAFVAPSDVSPYFLAMSVSILPTTLLAAPVVQYFQPQVVRMLEMPPSAQSDHTITRFTVALLLVVAVPSWIFWEWTEPIIRLWLKNSDQTLTVSGYTRTLLPAFALGSLCYVPVVLLLAAQDFKYQAMTSVLMTAVTLLLVFAFSYFKRIDWVCFAYLLYFVTASASVWWRSLTLPATMQMAKLSASKSVLPLLLLTIAAATFAVAT